MERCSPSSPLANFFLDFEFHPRTLGGLCEEEHSKVELGRSRSIAAFLSMVFATVVGPIGTLPILRYPGLCWRELLKHHPNPLCI